MTEKTVKASCITLTQLMGPTMANNYGNVHGGHIMKLCDEAGAMAAIKHAGRPCVTVAVDSMSFLSPVNVGNLLTVKAEVSWVGNTSVEAAVIVTAEDILTGEITHTNSAYFVYVALNRFGKPTKVPELFCETAEEKARFAAGHERRVYRLSQH